MKTRKKFCLALGLLALGLLQPGFAQSASAWLGAAAGGFHTAAIAEDGTVWSSGANWGGALGNGTKISSDLPAKALGLTNVVSVEAGDNHSLALKEDGTVWSWGHYADGPSLPDRTAPYQITGMVGAVQLAAGREHTLALKDDGTVWGWGRGLNGELGNVSVLNISQHFETPVQATGLTEITQIAAGMHHSLALKADGTVWAWGDNSSGQAGDPATFSVYEPWLPMGVIVSTPLQVPGLDNMLQVAAGSEHSCALKNDGTVWCWGYSLWSPVVAPGVEGSVTPVQVPNFDSVVFIAAGGYHTLAIRQDGTVWAWGSNSSGALGDTTETNSAIPVQVVGLSDIASVSGGRTHSVARGIDGKLWVWGGSEYGQLGAGELRYSATPVGLPTSAGTKAIGAGYRHWFLIVNNGSLNVEARGDNSSGQLGKGTTNPTWTVGDVKDFYGAAQITGGENHSLALKTNGTVWSWGDNSKGQMGVGTGTTESFVPVQVTALSGVGQVAAGRWHSLAVLSGSVWAWGDNSMGQLGTGDLTGSAAPLLVGGIGNVSKVAGGEGHTIALKQDGTVYQWGAGLLAPTKVSGLASIVDVAAGENHSLAVKGDGAVYLWPANSTTATLVSGIADVIKVAAGKNHSLALKTDGSIWSWGANHHGQLGDGSIDESTVPVPLTNPLSSIAMGTFVAVYAAGDNSYAINTSGRGYGWGDGNSGQYTHSGVNYHQTSPLQFGVTNYSAPDLTAPLARTAVVGRLTAFKVIGSDMDGNKLTYSAEGLPESATLDAETGAVSMVPTAADLGKRTVTLKATDDGLPEPITVSKPLALSVVSLNRAPVLNPVAPVSVYVGSRVTFKVTATDPDGDAVTLSAAGLPSGARFDPLTGIFTWVPTQAALAFNGGVYAPRFYAADNGVPIKSTSARFTINVLPYNYPPVITAIPPLTVKAGAKLVYKFSATDKNVGEVVTLAATGLPSGARFYPEINTVIWTPTGAQAVANGGLYKFRLTATDSNAQPKTASVLVPVTVTQ